MIFRPTASIPLSPLHLNCAGQTRDSPQSCGVRKYPVYLRNAAHSPVRQRASDPLLPVPLATAHEPVLYGLFFCQFRYGFLLDGTFTTGLGGHTAVYRFIV